MKLKKLALLLLATVMLFCNWGCVSEADPEALGYDELMRMVSARDVVCVSEIIDSREESLEYYGRLGYSVAYATIECTDVSYCIDIMNGRRFAVKMKYTIKIEELHETFFDFPWKKGDALTHLSEVLSVYPKQDCMSTILKEYGAETDENGALLLADGRYEWTPTADTVSSCTYSGMSIPLNKGERYIVQLMQHSANDFVSVCHVTPISEDSLYLKNEGYGLEMQDATIEQVAKELYEYIIQE